MKFFYSKSFIKQIFLAVVIFAVIICQNIQWEHMFLGSIQTTERLWLDHGMSFCCQPCWIGNSLQSECFLGWRLAHLSYRDWGKGVSDYFWSLSTCWPKKSLFWASSRTASEINPATWFCLCWAISELGEWR